MLKEKKSFSTTKGADLVGEAPKKDYDVINSRQKPEKDTNFNAVPYFTPSKQDLKLQSEEQQEEEKSNVPLQPLTQLHHDDKSKGSSLQVVLDNKLKFLLIIIFAILYHAVLYWMFAV